MSKAEKRAAKEAKRQARAQRLRQTPVPVFFCEPTGMQRCHRGHWCDACKVITYTDCPLAEFQQGFPDPRPTVSCRQCGQPVRMNSRGIDEEMRRTDTGETFEKWQALPPGAVWQSEAPGEDGSRHNWRSYRDKRGRRFKDEKMCGLLDRPGVDGRVLICRLPDGRDWVIDSRARNCDKKHDDDHWCWNRSGRPEDGTLDVRKGKPGQTTCGAGAGSIDTGTWHGYLHDGKLRAC